MKKDPTDWRNGFRIWKETGESPWEAGRRKELPEFKDGYESFLATLPDNQRKPGAYNTRRYWELNGKPKNFAEAIGKGMYNIQEDDGVLGWHANSVSYNENNDTYEFMKPNYHPTRWMEQVEGYDKDSEFQKDWKVQYNGPMLSDRYVRREKPGLKVKGGQLPKFAGGKESSFDDTIDFLRRHEGFKDTTYLDGNGIPTIGYGFTDSALVKKGKISRAEADKRLRAEVANREKFLSGLKNWNNLSEGSKTALRSYYYNYPAGFKDTTKFMRAWNAGNYEEAIRQVDAGMNDKKNRGLRTRRLEEQALLNADPFLRSNTVKPKSQLIQQVEQAPTYIAPFKYEPPVSTDYSLTNRAGGILNAWNGTDSPSYGGASLRMPTLEEYMRTNSILPITYRQ